MDKKGGSSAKRRLSSLKEECTARLRQDFLRVLESSEYNDLELNSTEDKYLVHKIFIKARLPSLWETLRTNSLIACCKLVACGSYSGKCAYGSQVEDTIKETAVEGKDYQSLQSVPLGNAMVAMIGDEETSDVTVIAEDQRYHVHRVILAARSDYFAAMFSGSWVESTSQEIQLHGVTSSCLLAVLQHIYGATVEPPDTVPLLDLVGAANMFALDGLREVVEYHLAKSCCFFHKPCKLCIAKFPECLVLASVYCFDSLKMNCMSWTRKYFDRLWCTRGFCTRVPIDIQQESVKEITDSLNQQNVVDVLKSCDRLYGNAPHISWASPVREMAAKVESESISLISRFFKQVAVSSQFQSLFEGIGWSPVLVGKIFDGVVSDLSVANCCSVLLTAWKIKTSESIAMNEDALSLVHDFFSRCKGYTIQQLVKVRDSEDYQHLPKTLQDEIQESSAYSFVEIGSTRKKPVVFTASNRGRKAQSVVSARGPQPSRNFGSVFGKRTTTNHQYTEK